MALHEPGTSPNEKDESRRQRATTAMDDISRSVTANLSEKIPYLVANRNKISPWGLHLVYRAYVAYMEKNQKETDLETSEALRLLKQTLSVINGKWKLAGAYLKLIEAREVMGLV